MFQSGITQYLKQKYWPRASRCDAAKNEAKGPSALDLNDVQGSFFFLGLGFVAALLALLAENVYVWWQLKKSVNNDNSENRLMLKQPKFRIVSRMNEMVR